MLFFVIVILTFLFEVDLFYSYEMYSSDSCVFAARCGHADEGSWERLHFVIQYPLKKNYVFFLQFLDSVCIYVLVEFAILILNSDKYHAWVNAEFLMEKCLVGILDEGQ